MHLRITSLVRMEVPQMPAHASTSRKRTGPRELVKLTANVTRRSSSKKYQSIDATAPGSRLAKGLTEA